MSKKYNIQNQDKQTQKQILIGGSINIEQNTPDK